MWSFCCRIEGYVKVKIKKIQSWLSAGGYEVWGLAKLIILRIWELIDSKTQRASLFYPAPTALADIHAGIWTSYQPAANLGNTEKVTNPQNVGSIIYWRFVSGSNKGYGWKVVICWYSRRQWLLPLPACSFTSVIALSQHLMFIDFIPLHKLFKSCVIVSLCGVAEDICNVIIMSGVTM